MNAYTAYCPCHYGLSRINPFQEITEHYSLTVDQGYRDGSLALRRAVVRLVMSETGFLIDRAYPR